MPFERELPITMKVSTLRYAEDFLKLGFAEAMQNQVFQAELSDYGRTEFEKMRKESLEGLVGYAEQRNRLC